ncbi:MAG: sugar phosphate isomerase/epimerase [Clostridia bacterium]|nr:sugar phosphate isomerase/epimerase [Clostridia bacterium]
MYLSQTNGPAIYFYDTVTESIEHIAKCGFTHVDVSFFSRFYKGSVYFTDGYKKIIEEYKEAFRRYGVVPVQAHEPTGNSIGDDGGEYYMKKTPRAIEMAAKIGCPSITVHAGAANGYEMTREEFVEGNVKALKKLIPYAEEYGIEILVENTGLTGLTERHGKYVTTAQDMIDLVDEVGHPLVAVNWDVGHANCCGLDEYEEMTKLGKRLRGVHVHDNMGFRRTDFDGKFYEGDMHTLPLMWSVDFDAVIKALIDVGYKGTFNFEVDAPKGLMRFISGKDELKEDAREILRQHERLLYTIGKTMLTKYGCFEG